MNPSSIIRILKGSRYPWTASVIGNDIVVTGQIATWFGGANDPQDDGETASGVSTKANPDFFGCALPMDLFPSIPPTLVTRTIRSSNRAHSLIWALRHLPRRVLQPISRVPSSSLWEAI